MEHKKKCKKSGQSPGSGQRRGIALLMLIAVSGMVYGNLITPEIMAVHNRAFLGVHYETAFSRRLFLGGEVAFSLENNGCFMIAPELAWRFDLGIRKITGFAGAGPVISVGYKGGADFSVRPFAGVRLKLGSRTALFTRMFLMIDADFSLGAAMGISFPL